ncbi:DUF4902 domain-containing protein [Burkholderia gladioli]|uniref:DUF4902 domain-containing protein n=1 Tax=Burkholderia gladioli (strain BSR3) TaxID=999541 RepID=F2LRS2_BURGS|nr:DUF4902 domain-containing protein [Burkholderia gladioli]AEA65566.1 hypothetical protein bgla_1p1750 [Burkholderia gladioli BSR3]MBW5286693.1 DUF4902 domain-containing protein [Burkholderia gladioli]
MQKNTLVKNSDTYVRLTLPEFYALQFHQYMCLRDFELLEGFWDVGIPAVNAGYYELVCRDVSPVVSVGCAWYVPAGQCDVKVGDDDISTNVMLLDASGSDCGAEGSRRMVQDWLCSGVRLEDLAAAVCKEVSGH